MEIKTKTSFGSSSQISNLTAKYDSVFGAEPLFGFEPVEPGASFPADAPNHPGHCQASLVPSAAEEAAKVKAQTEAMAAKLAQARQEMEQLKAA